MISKYKKIKREDLKKFILIWIILFLIAGSFPLLSDKNANYLCFGIASTFTLLFFTRPEVLRPFYYLWIRLGNFMSKTISKLILFSLFYFFFTPISIFLKLLGVDLLNIKVDRKKTSYWVERTKQPESMKHQY
tara:strand:+ start:548 stop:946 length:399 start_codon:yes stop_codon:yes gene_type:complete